MPTRLFTSSSEMGFSPAKNAISPREGCVSCAAILSSVVFPEPLWPTSATHSPAAIVSVTPRNARRIPYRFSTSLNWIRNPLAGSLPGPLPVPPFGRDASGVDTRDGSALDQIAKQLLGATALQRILRVRDCAGLAPQF